VETTLRAKFGEHGYYAIMLYVMENWRAMYTVGTRIPVDSPDYAERFEHGEWYRLGWALMEKWKGEPLYEGYKTRLEKIRRLKVITMKWQAEVRRRGRS